MPNCKLCSMKPEYTLSPYTGRKEYTGDWDNEFDMAGRLLVRTDDIVNKGLWRLFPTINCDRTKDIPIDYPGPIGVPITYVDKHNPERFEFIGMIQCPKINGKNLYRRLCIRNLHPDLPEKIDLIEWFERMKEPLEICVSRESVGEVMDYPKFCPECGRRLEEQDGN